MHVAHPKAPVELTVVGSINLDLVARVPRLPRPGESISARSLERYPGGKGANQAVAAARLGARVRFIGAVGNDNAANEAVRGLRDATVDLQLGHVDAVTGTALILVADDGENQITVVPGANALLKPQTFSGPVLCQLEVRDDVVLAAAQYASYFALNASPARRIDIEPDLLIVNQYERDQASYGRRVAVTCGARGAVLFEGKREIARAIPPVVRAVDGTAAGDAFAACLVTSFLEGRPPQAALERACAAGALAASRHGAQPSLPTALEVERAVSDNRATPMRCQLGQALHDGESPKMPPFPP